MQDPYAFGIIIIQIKRSFMYDGDFRFYGMLFNGRLASRLGSTQYPHRTPYFHYFLVIRHGFSLAV